MSREPMEPSPEQHPNISVLVLDSELCEAMLQHHESSPVRTNPGLSLQPVTMSRGVTKALFASLG